VAVDTNYSVILNFNRSNNTIVANITNQISDAKYLQTFNYNFSGIPTWGFVLMPYFGGDNAAPNRMNIFVTYNLQL
jgi:hypothetical protein